jgi:hypothetical protein
MNGIESSIYFMLGMMFIGMPAAVIGGITWECRKRTRLNEAAAEAESTVPVSTDESISPKPR